MSLPVEAVKDALTKPVALNSGADIGWNGWPADAPKPAIAPFTADEAKAYQEAWAKCLKIPADYTNSIGMKFVLIPPGEFLMGSTAVEIEEAIKHAGENKQLQEFLKSEAPQHKVILTQPAYLGVNEVTQAEYEKVMGVNPSNFTSAGTEKELVAGTDSTNRPVETISWDNTAEFCAKLSQREGFNSHDIQPGIRISPLNGAGYRLPTEAEWEYACRAGTTTKYWNGDQDEDLVTAGWLSTNSGGPTHPVGELRANPFGLRDIHGNVWEWVEDWWDPKYYERFKSIPATNPICPSSASSWRIIRGGSRYDVASASRAAHREVVEPLLRNGNVGFRVSLTVDRVRQLLKLTGPAIPTDTKATASTFLPLAPEWIERVSKLSPEEQVKEVSADMKRRNPEWDGKFKEVEIQDGRVRGLVMDGTHIVDLNPIRVLKRLYWISCAAGNDKGRLADISPLSDLPELGRLDVPGQPELSDLTALKSLPIIYLELQKTGLSDLSPLRGKPLIYLHLCGNLHLSDISPVRDSSFENGLCIHQTGIVDISSLKGAPVQKITLLASQYDADIVASWPSLTSIDFAGTIGEIPREKVLRLKDLKTLAFIDGQSAAEFWKEYEADSKSHESP